MSKDKEKKHKKHEEDEGQNVETHEDKQEEVKKHKDKGGKKAKKHSFDNEVRLLQIELIKLQNWVKEKNKRILIVFEGRDAAGKGGLIKTITEHLNPRGARVVALGKPSDAEMNGWYFQRYVPHLPVPGEIVLFDRSWYNRAGVEHVMGFCTTEQHQRFLRQCPMFEQMLIDDGILFFKYYLSVSKEVQEKRFEARDSDPLKKWKFSPIDKEAQKYFDQYTKAKEEMFSRTHTPYTPWMVVDANDKKVARLNIIKDILLHIEYTDKDKADVSFMTDPNIMMIYSRLAQSLAE
jgi:polyphosphate kinase